VKFLLPISDLYAYNIMRNDIFVGWCELQMTAILLDCAVQSVT